MKIWKRFAQKFIDLFFPAVLEQGPIPLRIESAPLGRTVFAHLYLPKHKERKWSLLLLNDGQDEERLDLKVIHQSFRSHPKNLLIVAIHAGDRKEEYGTASIKDYQGRGKQSAAYQEFIVQELLPSLRAQYPISNNYEDVGIAGFSLGALSAIDTAWNHPSIFGFVGVFSGALWWRKVPFKQEDPDAHRIMHDRVMDSKFRKQRFWLQAGTKDETADRNNNGIIDAIDDTIHLKGLLEQKIPNGEHYCKYVEVIDGEHHPDTWKQIMPDFLDWIFTEKG